MRGGREPVGDGIGQQIAPELRPVGHERLPARILVHVAVAAFERKANGDSLLDLRRTGYPGQRQTQPHALRHRRPLLNGFSLLPGREERTGFPGAP